MSTWRKITTVITVKRITQIIFSKFSSIAFNKFKSANLLFFAGCQGLGGPFYGGRAFGAAAVEGLFCLF